MNAHPIEKMLALIVYFPDGSKVEIPGEDVFALDNLNMIAVCRDPQNAESGLVKYCGLPFVVRSEPTGLARAGAGDLPRITG